jgi:D-tyrosyl-tRNA(Tyr) deacylase
MEPYSSINKGLLVLVGFDSSDNLDDIEKATRKIVQLRIFADENGMMNKSLMEIKGELLIVSQFTLYADIQKGNRPSFVKAASPCIAIPLYEALIAACKETVSAEMVKTGVFGADMAVSLINDGPVTISFDSKK